MHRWEGRRKEEALISSDSRFATYCTTKPDSHTQKIRKKMGDSRYSNMGIGAKFAAKYAGYGLYIFVHNISRGHLGQFEFRCVFCRSALVGECTSSLFAIGHGRTEKNSHGNFRPGNSAWSCRVSSAFVTLEVFEAQCYSTMHPSSVS